MTIPLPPERTVEEISAFVVQQAMAKVSGAVLARATESKFGLSPDDTDLVCDRVFGGVVRAATGSPANRPDPVKDPFAFASYERAKRHPEIIATLLPSYVQQSKRAWWQFWRR